MHNRLIAESPFKDSRLKNKNVSIYQDLDCINAVLVVGLDQIQITPKTKQKAFHFDH